MLQKIKTAIKFDTKRDRNIITPCCNKRNTDGKYVTYKGCPNIYGYCHSCGKASLPPPIYVDDKGNEYTWNETSKKFETAVLQMSHKTVLQNGNTQNNACNTEDIKEGLKIQYVDFNIVNAYYRSPQENTLLKYLRSKYDKERVDKVKKMYYIGTSNNYGTVFWSINKEGNAQKAKVSYYTEKGKRTNRFEVPYKNEDGYYSCLFGEHLLKNNEKPIVLVESEKTAIVASIELPNYTWLAYGGINGLTNKKLKVLEGENVIIIPDMSEKAVSIMNNKLPYFKTIGLNAKVWDMTKGKTDEQLKKEGLYNCDIEDIFRKSLL